MKHTKLETRRDRLVVLQGEVFQIWRQIEAFGFLLEKQGDAAEGVTELQGLGLSLNELAERLGKVWRRLDIADFPE